MSDTYKLQYDGMTLTYPGWGGSLYDMSVNLVSNNLKEVNL